MRRTDIEGEGKGTDANQAKSLSGGPPSGPKIIQFPRDRRAASVDLAAGDDSGSSPASFESLGSVTQAVVMRLANKRIRVKVQVQTTEGTE
jgi:hypothetical protein